MTSNWSPDSVNVPPPTRDRWGLGAAGTTPGAVADDSLNDPLPYNVPDATSPAVQPVFIARTQGAPSVPLLAPAAEPFATPVAIPPPAGFPPPAYFPEAANHPLAPAVPTHAMPSPVANPAPPVSIPPPVAYPAPPMSIPPGGYGPPAEATNYGRGPMPAMATGPYPPIGAPLNQQFAVPQVATAAPASGASLGRGVTMGVLAAAILGIAWYAVAVASGYQVSYLGVLLGAGVALSVARGANRGGFDVAAAAVAITVPAMAIIQYFVARHYLGAAVVGSENVPLWLGRDGISEMLDLYVKGSPRVLPFWGFSLLGAVKVANQKVGV